MVARHTRMWAAVVGASALLLACPFSSGPGDRGDSCKAHGDCEDDLICNAKDECDAPWGFRWRLSILSARVSAQDPTGDTWDSGGGNPDPYVVVRVDGTSVLTTQTQQDTLTPSWNESTSMVLQNNTLVQVALYDEDLLLSTGIVQTANAPVGIDELRGGRVTAYATTAPRGDGGTPGADQTTTLVYEWTLDE